MKKLVALLCVCVTCVLCFFGCAQTETITCYVPNGEVAHELLHTSYTAKPKYVKE
ncbi:MAG: hypothetical protein ACI4QH_04515 [Candidatus Fimimonas sp.]